MLALSRIPDELREQMVELSIELLAPDSEPATYNNANIIGLQRQVQTLAEAIEGLQCEVTRLRESGVPEHSLCKTVDNIFETLIKGRPTIIKL